MVDRSDAVRAAAAAIANARGARRGAPPISNVLEALRGTKSYGEIMEDAEAALRAAVPAPFQDRVAPWMLACFGAEISADTEERSFRFLEEALELVQANGCSREQALDLVEYVYGRPVGVTSQEVGGVMVTLAALCLAAGIDMQGAAETELARVWTKVEAIRAKQAAKPSFSALPGLPGAASEPLRFIYRNWRGEIAERAVRPLRIWFGSTKWHPEPQWLLRAVDLDLGAERDFAIGEIVGTASTRPSYEPDRTIGIEAGADAIEAAILDPAARVIEIVGPAGSGKTKMRHELARRLTKRFGEKAFIGISLPTVEDARDAERRAADTGELGAFFFGSIGGFRRSSWLRFMILDDIEKHPMTSEGSPVALAERCVQGWSNGTVIVFRTTEAPAAAEGRTDG